MDIVVPSLPARQLEVLALAAQGRTIDEVARAMHISPDTVKSHLNMAMATLGALNRTHAAAIAVAWGLVPAADVVAARVERTWTPRYQRRAARKAAAS